MTGSAKPELVLAREVPSDSSRDKTYRVSVFSDESATCACANYIIQGVNRGNLGYQCKHIRRVLGQLDVRAELERAQAGLVDRRGTESLRRMAAPESASEDKRGGRRGKTFDVELGI